MKFLQSSVAALASSPWPVPRSRSSRWRRRRRDRAVGGVARAQVVQPAARSRQYHGGQLGAALARRRPQRPRRASGARRAQTWGRRGSRVGAATTTTQRLHPPPPHRAQVKKTGEAAASTAGSRGALMYRPAAKPGSPSPIRLRLPRESGRVSVRRGRLRSLKLARDAAALRHNEPARYHGAPAYALRGRRRGRVPASSRRGGLTAPQNLCAVTARRTGHGTASFPGRS